MSTADVTWTDDDGVVHGLLRWREATKCGARITIKVFDARTVNCVLCLGWVEPEYRRTISPSDIPNMQQIPRPKRKP